MHVLTNNLGVSAGGRSQAALSLCSTRKNTARAQAGWRADATVGTGRNGLPACRGQHALRAVASHALSSSLQYSSEQLRTEAILLKDYVNEGVPSLDKFEFTQLPVAALQPGELLVDLLYLSVDSLTRGRMHSEPLLSLAPFQLNKPLMGYAIARVKQSREGKVPEGVLVTGLMHWQQLQVLPSNTVHVVDEQLLKACHLPASAYLGVLGMPGFTAYASLALIGKPKHTDTVFVSNAAGSIGLTLGQLCKHVYGCANVVGSVSSDQKVDLLHQYGYDAVFNHKDGSIMRELSRSCPKGIDLFFDNMGGATLQIVLEMCNTHARMVVCTALGQYNEEPGMFGVTNLWNVVMRRIVMKGFLAQDHPELQPQFMKDMSGYLHSGKIKHVEQRYAQGGLQAAPQALQDLMHGTNLGKVVVQCGSDPYRK